jgi:hypothetical protein
VIILHRRHHLVAITVRGTLYFPHFSHPSHSHWVNTYMRVLFSFIELIVLYI